ncbi:hypothetical protein DICSQDRAFT_171921 [Dichomitus squalens LYAD-421 SS1]|uniref:Uncharacterized protein n=1 Tax=Dichomitus squalens (strain LYAD-421) TaxID=732165 RepID=R7SUR5_DICSQ|nr:uncharacterized protein DICSQDRAFT_171921 [Dichomitus squalens LYAD-421 SS1]EJF59520.1 hypothetical protein DICSQDRAFT_171921 [Dichomitus squalens LYAD-421 SS1]
MSIHPDVNIGHSGTTVLGRSQRSNKRQIRPSTAAFTKHGEHVTQPPKLPPALPRPSISSAAAAEYRTTRSSPAGQLLPADQRPLQFTSGSGPGACEGNFDSEPKANGIPTGACACTG